MCIVAEAGIFFAVETVRLFRSLPRLDLPEILILPNHRPSGTKELDANSLCPPSVCRSIDATGRFSRSAVPQLPSICARSTALLITCSNGDRSIRFWPRESTEASSASTIHHQQRSGRRFLPAYQRHWNTEQPRAFIRCRQPHQQPDHSTTAIRHAWHGCLPDHQRHVPSWLTWCTTQMEKTLFCQLSLPDRVPRLWLTRLLRPFIAAGTSAAESGSQKGRQQHRPCRSA
jgi:hypothetical protein